MCSPCRRLTRPTGPHACGRVSSSLYSPRTVPHGTGRGALVHRGRCADDLRANGSIPPYVTVKTSDLTPRGHQDRAASQKQLYLSRLGILSGNAGTRVLGRFSFELSSRNTLLTLPGSGSVVAGVSGLTTPAHCSCALPISCGFGRYALSLPGCRQADLRPSSPGFTTPRTENLVHRSCASTLRCHN